MTVTFERMPGEKRGLTVEQQIMLDKAESMPIVFDDDCPELTGELWDAFVEATKERNRRRLEREGRQRAAYAL